MVKGYVPVEPRCRRAVGVAVAHAFAALASCQLVADFDGVRSGEGPESLVGVPAASEAHTCVQENRGIRCWGSSRQIEESQGVRVSEVVEAPTLVDGLQGVSVRQLVLGGGHSCALGEDGLGWCWGLNNQGQLGRFGGKRASYGDPVPALIEGLVGVHQLALGAEHSCALDAEGRVLCWGSNTFGQLGRLSGVASTPGLVEGLYGVRQVAAGGNQSCALDEEGHVLCWGRGLYPPQLSPIEGLTGVDQVAVGESHVCVSDAEKRVRCWGNNDSGQLGDTMFEPVENLSDVRQLALGAEHSCALDVQGRVLCWGNNQYGQLGRRDNFGAARPNPTAELVEGLGSALRIAAGSMHNCAQIIDGRVLCWGGNEFGQLGLAGEGDSYEARPVFTKVE